MNTPVTVSSNNQTLPQRNSIHSINNNNKSQKPEKAEDFVHFPKSQKERKIKDVWIHKSKQHEGRWGCGNRLGDRRYKHSVPRSEPRWEPASMGVHSQGVRNRSHTACPHHHRLLHHHSLHSYQRGPQSQSWLLALPHVPPSCLYVSFTLKLWFFFFFWLKIYYLRLIYYGFVVFIRFGDLGISCFWALT